MAPFTYDFFEIKKVYLIFQLKTNTIMSLPWADYMMTT